MKPRFDPHRDGLLPAGLASIVFFARVILCIVLLCGCQSPQQARIDRLNQQITMIQQDPAFQAQVAAGVAAAKAAMVQR